MWSKNALDRSQTSTGLVILKPEGKLFLVFRACTSLNFPWLGVGGIKHMYFPGTDLALSVSFQQLSGLGSQTHVHQCLKSLCQCALGLVTTLHMCNRPIRWEWLPLLLYSGSFQLLKAVLTHYQPLIQTWSKPHTMQHCDQVCLIRSLARNNSQHTLLQRDIEFKGIKLENY